MTNPSARTVDSSPLDHVMWSALTGPHAHFAQGDATAKRYPPDIAPFGAVLPPGEGTAQQMATLLKGAKNVAVVAASDARPFPGLEPSMRVMVDQMVLEDPARFDPVAEIDAVTLGAADVPDMLRLVEATRPGPFQARTREMGRYIGVRNDGQLLAMTGERLKVPGFTEVSAVCVDPSCRGRGYAAGLMKSIVHGILARGETPFLHVVTENSTAIALYERLGFRRRKQFCMNVFDAPV
jgi:ribosomal protein S18 acetylase RimI-like enzyme